jgi:hypothetical protein
MKTMVCRRLWLAAFLGFSLLGIPSVSAQPQITSIQLEEGHLLVTVSVPPGLRKITLESRLRLAPGGWEPRIVERLSGEGGNVVFRLPASENLEVLRVRADATEPLPESFYQGDQQFEPQPAQAGSRWDGPLDGAPGEVPIDIGTDREVVESDIWKLRDDTLYFFNQFRGLQILDVSHPAEPRVTGSLSLPAAGEQMYLLESGEVVLLAHGGCWWRSGEPEARVMIVRPGAGAPEVVAELPVEGWIQESRLVGNALYVATQHWRPVPDSPDGAWQGGILVSGFDLTVPSLPVVRNSLWYPGYAQVVTATDRFLFVTAQDPADWRTSILHLIDIGRPDGTLERSGSIRAAGTIKDKFKIHLHQDVLTIISEVLTTTLFTQLETYSVTDSNRPLKLGNLSLGLSERLHATRFVGDRVYIVTFFVRFQMDPLWVVSLADPAHPAILGELEVPGWSTFLYPMGDRLLAAGIETNQTTVSLFDVRDPAQPALLERVALGSGWSWSEANQDEKAFGVFPEDGLVLVPYQSWEEDAWRSRVQLIDLSRDSLVARGTIDHSMSPRRAALHRGQVLSISGRELLSVDITNRDQPKVSASLDLAWPVDRLLVHDPFLIEVSRGQGGWGDPAPPALWITPAEQPDVVLRAIQLKHSVPILGTAIHGRHLYVVQGVEGASWFGPDADDPSTPPPNPVPNLFLTVYSLEALPDLVQIGAVEVIAEPVGWSAEFDVLMPKPGLLLLAGGGGGYWNSWLDLPTIAPEPGVDGPGFWRPFLPWGAGGRLIAFDVTEPTRPQWASDVTLAQNGTWDFSAAHLADGLVFLSHQVVEQAPPVIVYDEASGTWQTNAPPAWMWIQRSFLNVVDYEDPTDPTIRRPLEIPGPLIGLSHAGALLYTAGARWKPDEDWSYDPTVWLTASAYDGAAVRRVDSMELPNNWPQPLLARDGDIFLGRTGMAPHEPHSLEWWRLSNQGSLTGILKIEMTAPAERLHARGALLAVQVAGDIALFNASTPDALPRIGGATPPGCLWVDLARAEGSLERGLWLPMGLNGVWRLPVVSGIPAAP